MSVLPTTDRSGDQPRDHDASQQRTAAPRGAIVAVALLVGGFVIGALVIVIGPDVRMMWRRLNRVTAGPQVADRVSPGAVDRSPRERPMDRAFTSAADAQISAPRRRVVESAPAIVPFPDDGAGEVADASRPDVAIEPKPAAELSKLSDPVPMVEPDVDLLETAAELVSRSWQDFEYPVRWGAAENSKSRMTYAHHRIRLLNAVVHQKPSALSLQFVRKDYEAARTQFDDDPRLDYVFGLALWKHGEFDEAIEMFQTAARLDEKPFLPAALAVAWGRFLNHDERRGLDQLHSVARVLASSNDSFPPAAQREQAATAMGRAMGYLAKPGRVPELNDTIELTKVALRRRLPVELQAAYDTGVSDVEQRESELLRFVGSSFDQMQSQHVPRRDELQAKIDALRTEMRDGRNADARTHRTHVETIGDILKDVTDVNGQIDKLRPTIKKLQQSITKYATPQAHIERKTMPSHYHEVIGPGGQPMLVQSNATMTIRLNETASERATRISQLSKTRDELKKIQDDLSKLREKQQDLVNRRNTEDRQHRSNGIESRQERVARMQEQRALERELDQLSRAFRRTKRLHDSFDSIAAYIPWDVEIEAEAVRFVLNPPTRPRPDGGGELSVPPDQK